MKMTVLDAHPFAADRCTDPTPSIIQPAGYLDVPRSASSVGALHELLSGNQAQPLKLEIRDRVQKITVADCEHPRGPAVCGLLIQRRKIRWAEAHFSHRRKSLVSFSVDNVLRSFSACAPSRPSSLMISLAASASWGSGPWAIRRRTKSSARPVRKSSPVNDAAQGGRLARLRRLRTSRTRAAARCDASSSSCGAGNT